MRHSEALSRISSEYSCLCLQRGTSRGICLLAMRVRPSCEEAEIVARNRFVIAARDLLILSWAIGEKNSTANTGVAIATYFRCASDRASERASERARERKRVRRRERDSVPLAKHVSFDYKSAARRATSRTAQLTAWAVVDPAINFNERAALRLNLISIAVITR